MFGSKGEEQKKMMKTCRKIMNIANKTKDERNWPICLVHEEMTKQIDSREHGLKNSKNVEHQRMNWAN